jgi:ATP-dependent DNA helicase RecQ
VTYLELLGALRQTTPFHAGYKVKPLVDPRDIVAQFAGEPGEFLRELLKRAKKGRVWLTVDPESIATAMGAPRERIVRALEVLESRALVELSSSDLRHRFVRLPCVRTADDLTAELVARFTRREEQDIARLEQVRQFVVAPTCRANLLSAHFGEQRAAPCGHCSACDAPGSTGGHSPAPKPAAEWTFDGAPVLDLAAEHPAALGEPRQLARFLCGTSSPALTRSKLSRHPLFGSLAERPFHDVLARCAAAMERGRRPTPES